MIKMNELIFTILWVIVSISCSTESDVVLEDRSYSSNEIQSFCEAGSIKEYFKSAIHKMREYKQNATEEARVNEIIGFLCANVLIRDIQSTEYKAAGIDFPGESPSGVWRRYIHESQRHVARLLRNLLKPGQYNDCADSICRGWPVGSKHAHCDARTVKVAEQLRTGTTLNITEILKKEQPRFLFTVDDMYYINTFINATGNAEFPYFTFHRSTPSGDTEQSYAAPQLRTPSDKGLCGLAICTPGQAV